MAAAARTTSARTLPIPRFDWEVWPHLADPVVDAAAPLAAGMKRLPARRRSRRAACCRRCRPRRPQAWRPRPRPRLPRPRRSRAGSTSRGLLWRSTGQMKGSVLHSRMESITAYTNERGQRRTGTAGQSATPVTADDMSALNEWPSHARRNRARLEDEADGQKKRKGRGVLKGVKASMKRFASGSKKLDISFSETLGGTIGMNNRSFKDDVVISMKRKLPLIGARRWSDIHPTVHRLIVADMIDRYNLEDTPANEQKILKIAMERYRGWRATLQRQEFETNLMAQFNSQFQSKFQEFSQQMEKQKLQTLQMFKKSNQKENISPNLQTPLSQSPAKRIYPPHSTVQGSRMLKAMDGIGNDNGKK